MTEFLDKKLDFNKFSFNELVILLSVIDSSKKRDLDYLRNKYGLRGSHFDEVLGFLLTLGLVENDNNKITLSSNYSDWNKYTLKSIISNLALKNKALRNRYFADYLNLFTFKGDRYACFPNSKQRSSTSGVRNLLISLGIVTYDAVQRAYAITPEGMKYIELGKTKNLTTKQLSKKLIEQEKMGLAAEKVILRYERTLLKRHRILASNVEHVSQSNVAAGYDIKSFRYINSKKSEPKYIEVKAVSDSDNQFFWSRNEMDTAKNHKDKYYLYLLPVKSGNIFDLKALKIIQNPYKLVLQKRGNWQGTVELMSFRSG